MPGGGPSMMAPDEGGGGSVATLSPTPTAADRDYFTKLAVFKPPLTATATLPTTTAIVKDTKRITAGSIGSGVWTGPLMLAVYAGVIFYILKTRN